MIKKRSLRFILASGKRGQGVDWLTAEVVLILVSIMLFVSIMVFVSRAASSSLFYEELYAKEIGTLLESAKPGQNYSIDITPALAIAKSNNKNFEWVQQNFFGVYGTNVVRVQTTANGGFEYAVFKKINITKESIAMAGNKVVLTLEI